MFSERIRKALYREKMGAEDWLAIHRAAHAKGIRTNATLLYGHIETHEERIDHLLTLRDLQDDTGGFFSFIPLEFQLGYTNLVERQASALDGLKTIAASRLVLDNFPHIKAYWVMLGEETASMALQWGADDLDGTIGEEKIAHAALATSPLGLTAHRMLKLMREAGRIPVQRDARYRALTMFPMPPAPTHWSQRGARDVDAEIPLKIDPAIADATAIGLEDEEQIRSKIGQKYTTSTDALFGKAKKRIHVAEEKVRLKLEQLTDVAEPTPADEAREGMDALLYLAAAGGGQDDERMDRLIHSVAFHNPRLAARLLGVFAATARDPLKLESCVRSLEGRVSALQRTGILQHEGRRALAADLYLLGRARRAVDQIQKQAEHRPGEISLLRQAIDRLWADLRS